MEPNETVSTTEQQPFWLTDTAELAIHWPSGIQRCFYLYQVGQGIVRGQHRHQQCHMALSCPQGSVTIYAQTRYDQYTYQLDNTRPWLVLPPTVWRMMHEFSPGALLVVLASEPFDPQDHISEPYRPLALHPL